MGIIQIGTGSQGYIIDKVEELLAAEPGGDSKVKATRGGICYMLSMEWIREVILSGVTPVLVDFNDQAEVDRNLETFRQIANNFYTYVQNFLAQRGGMADARVVVQEATDHQLRSNWQIDRLYARLGSWGQMRAVASYTVSNGSELTSKFLEVKPQYFLLGIIWNGGGHEMAGTLMGDGHIVFYDPNDGVYLIDSFEELVAWIYARYQNMRQPTSLDFCEIAPNPGGH